MTATVVDIDKVRMGRPSRKHIELYRQVALDERMEVRVRKDETARLLADVEPQLRRLEMVARRLSSPAALASVETIRGALQSHARRWGIEPPRAA